MLMLNFIFVRRAKAEFIYPKLNDMQLNVVDSLNRIHSFLHSNSDGTDATFLTADANSLAGDP